jgi:hypothetical protein
MLVPPDHVRVHGGAGEREKRDGHNPGSDSRPR